VQDFFARARRRYPDLSPRDPSGSALHAVLRDQLETFLAERERADAPLPRFVTDELRGVLDCGVLAKGCAHFRCERCGLDRAVALSCKGRGFCPRCCGRRMNETARHLAERVFPEVRTRQWVLSFPFELRWALAFHHALVLDLARITYEESARRYRRLCRDSGLRLPRGGAFFVMQRFGSDLRLNVHLHALFLDGTFGEDGAFFTAPAPSPKEVEQILASIVARANELLEERQDALEDIDDGERSCCLRPADPEPPVPADDRLRLVVRADDVDGHRVAHGSAPSAAGGRRANSITAPSGPGGGTRARFGVHMGHASSRNRAPRRLGRMRAGPGLRCGSLARRRRPGSAGRAGRGHRRRSRAGSPRSGARRHLVRPRCGLGGARRVRAGRGRGGPACRRRRAGRGGRGAGPRRTRRRRPDRVHGGLR
jgi:hypothetical protein